MAEQNAAFAALAHDLQAMRRLLDDRAEDGRHLAALLKAESRLTGARLDALGRQVDAVGSHLGTLHDKVGAVGSDVGALVHRVDALERAIAAATRKGAPTTGDADG